MLALGLWQLFLSSRTRTYTWASTCPGPSALRRRLHLEWNVVREGAWVYKIYISTCLCEPTLSIPCGYASRQPLSWESPCKTRRGVLRKLVLVISPKAQRTQVTQLIEVSTCSALTPISREKTRSRVWPARVGLPQKISRNLEKNITTIQTTWYFTE